MNKSRRATLAVACAALIVLAATASSASAAMTGIQRIAPATASSSSNKGVTGACPAGTRVLGVGGDTTPGNGKVLLDDIRPSADLTKVIVNAREDESGTEDSWYVQGFAICAPAPPGLQRVAKTSSNNSSNNKLVTVTCPSGKRVLGTGGEINSPNGQVLLKNIRPNAGLQSVSVGAGEDQNGNPKTWSLTAYAVCASPVAGLQRQKLETVTDSNSPKVRNVTCPAGRMLTGAGVDINSPNGQVILDAVYPDIPVTGAGTGAFEDESGNANPWSLTTYAICVDTAERVAVPLAMDDLAGNAIVECPAAKELTDLSGEISGGRGQASLTFLDYTGEGAVVQALEDDDGSASPWSGTAYGICSRPPPGLVSVGDSSDASSFDKIATVECPAGKRVIGAGGGLFNGVVFGVGGTVVMRGVIPHADLTGVTVRGVEDQDGADSNWFVFARAWCATPPAGLELVSATTRSESEESARAAVVCPAGKVLLGTGFEVLTGVVGLGEVMIDDLRPGPLLRGLVATAFEDQDGTNANWGITAHAICANP